MKAKTLCSIKLFVIVAMLAATPLELSARTLGMVADNATDSVTVFDADTHAVLGTVFIPPEPDFPNGPTGNVLITPDLKRGFVTNAENHVVVIDLTTSPPSLAGGTNPIPISSVGKDMSISPDGKLLVVSSGPFFISGPISVIDIAAQAEISTGNGGNTTSMNVCSDGSILVTTIAQFDTGKVRRLTLSATGTVTDTGEVVSLTTGNVNNVYCAPGAQSGVVILPGAITSFTIPGLSVVDTRPLSGSGGESGAINKAGNRVFVQGSGIVDVFELTPGTGVLGVSPLLTFPAGSGGEFGIDEMALHPNGTKLFVSEFGDLNVYNPSTGALLASITDPNIVEPTGVTVVTEVDPCAGDPPTGAIVGTKGPDILNGTPLDDTIFGLGGPDIINGGGGNDLICGGAGNDQLGGGAGNDQIVGGTGIDQITGGAGDDTLNTQDGVSGNDSANGGPGTDTCTGDPGDALSSCNP